MVSLHLSPTSDQPYAWDYPNPDGQFPTEPFDELGVISSLLNANFIFTTVIGGILSFTLFYLVAFKTTGALKDYRKLLFICSINDITYWALDNLMGTKLKEKDGVFMVKLEGPIRFLERETRLRIFSFYIFCACLVNSLLPAQVYFRYYCLSRPHPLSTKQTTVLFLISLLIAAPSYYLAYLGYGNSADVRPGYNYGQLWYREVPLPPVLYADIRSINQKIYFVYGGCLVFMSYAISIFFGYKTMRKVSLMYDSCSESTKRLQRQLNNYLLVQFVIPLIVCVGPMLCFVIPAFLYVDSGKLCLIIGVLLSWIPMLNALITMIVIVPYRRVLLNTFIYVLPQHKCKRLTTIRDYKSSHSSGWCVLNSLLLVQVPLYCSLKRAVTHSPCMYVVLLNPPNCIPNAVDECRNCIWLQQTTTPTPGIIQIQMVNFRIPHLSYDELAVYQPFCRINSAFATVIGAIMSFTLLYLIVFKTYGPLKSYRNILLICSVNDLVFWFLINAITPRMKVTDGVFMLKVDGLARYFNRELRLFLCSAFIYCACVMNALLPVQAYLRYNALARPQSLSTWKTLSLLSIALFVGLPAGFLSYIIYGSSADIRPGYNYAKLWYREIPIPLLFCGDTRSVYQQSTLLYSAAVVGLSYVMAMFIGCRTMKKIRALYNSCSHATRRLHDQLNKYLIVQSIVPLLVCVLPVFLVTVPTIFYANVGSTFLLIEILLSWVPLVNPIVTIFVIVPYRRWVLKNVLFVKCPSKIESVLFRINSRAV